MIKTSATRLQPGGRQKGQRTLSESPLEPFEQHLRPRAAHLESGLTRADDANAQHQTEAEPPLLIYRPQPLRKGRARVFRSRGQGGGLARPDLLSQLGSRAPPAGHGARRRCAAKRGCRRLVPLAAVLTCSPARAEAGHWYSGWLPATPGACEKVELRTSGALMATAWVKTNTSKRGSEKRAAELGIPHPGGSQVQAGELEIIQSY